MNAKLECRLLPKTYRAPVKTRKLSLLWYTWTLASFFINVRNDLLSNCKSSSLQQRFHFPCCRSDIVLKRVVRTAPVPVLELRWSELRPCSTTVAGARHRLPSVVGIDEGTDDVALRLRRSFHRVRRSPKSCKTSKPSVSVFRGTVETQNLRSRMIITKLHLQSYFITIYQCGWTG